MSSPANSTTFEAAARWDNAREQVLEDGAPGHAAPDAALNSTTVPNADAVPDATPDLARDGQSPTAELADKKAMQFIVITGLSGAGKALAMRHFEDFGFFCVDNLPPTLLPMFAELCARGSIGRVAVVADVRGGTFFNDLSDALERLRADGFAYHILFLDADDDLLVKRFKETRRRHPLSDQFPDLQEAIAAEREALVTLRARADKIVNTSHVTPRELRAAIQKTFVDEADGTQMLVQIESFGFKHGLPQDADIVFDVRFLANPNYDREIGHLDGFHQPIIDYVMREPLTQQFLQHLGDFVGFCAPQFEKEGKAYATIAIGCTGGRHRSVVLTNWLAELLRAQGHRVSASHRDVHRSAIETQNFVGPPGHPGPAADQSDQSRVDSAVTMAQPPDAPAAQVGQVAMEPAASDPQNGGRS
jgi:RNase adapter protein RapZ